MTGAAEPGGLRGAPRAHHSPGHYQPVKQSIPHLADALLFRPDGAMPFGRRPASGPAAA